MYREEDIIERTPIEESHKKIASEYIRILKENDRNSFKSLLSENVIKKINNQVDNAKRNFEVVSFEEMLEHNFVAEQNKYQRLNEGLQYFYADVMHDKESNIYVLFLDEDTAKVLKPGQLTHVYPIKLVLDSNNEYKVDFAEW